MKMRVSIHASVVPKLRFDETEYGHVYRAVSRDEAKVERLVLVVKYVPAVGFAATAKAAVVLQRFGDAASADCQTLHDAGAWDYYPVKDVKVEVTL